MNHDDSHFVNEFVWYSTVNMHVMGPPCENICTSMCMNMWAERDETRMGELMKPELKYQLSSWSPFIFALRSSSSARHQRGALQNDNRSFSDGAGSAGRPSARSAARAGDTAARRRVRRCSAPPRASAAPPSRLWCFRQQLRPVDRSSSSSSILCTLRSRPHTLSVGWASWPRYWLLQRSSGRLRRVRGAHRLHRLLEAAAAAGSELPSRQTSRRVGGEPERKFWCRALRAAPTASLRQAMRIVEARSSSCEGYSRTPLCQIHSFRAAVLPNIVF